MNPHRKNLLVSGHGTGVKAPHSSMASILFQTISYGLMATLVTGCATKRSGYDVPEIALPARYKNSPSRDSPNAKAEINAPKKDTKPNDTREIALTEWWRCFGNTELVDLVDRGLANNPDVRIATQQMAQAKTRVDQAHAGMLPTISAPIQMAGGTVSPGISSVSQKSFQASLQGSFRPDLWGERSSAADSAKFILWQAAFNRDNVQRNMAASLASSYIEYLSLNDRLRVARETDALLSSMLISVEKRVGAGDATLIDLDGQKAAIYSVRATLPALEQQRENSLTSIAFLVGSVPGSLHLSDAGLASLILPDVVPALPSSLLLRRPDIRMAEARMLSADADIDVARARMLPPLDLSAQIGHSSLAISQILQPSTLFWNAISSLTLSIFDSGKLKSDKENAQALHEEMVETYARTIYQAAREVENALAAIRSSELRLASQQDAAESAKRAWDASAKVYEMGGLDYQALLDAERNFHRYLDEYLRIKMESYHGYINLFQAVGGGVNFVKPLPGKGTRPAQAEGNAAGSISVAGYKMPLSTAPAKSSSPTDGVDWVAGLSSKIGGPMQVENFWQVELPGLYHRSTINATWNDLNSRYPKLMKGRVVRPLLNGQNDNSPENEMSLFRLFVSKFSTPAAANELCKELKANYQRCRVVSSRLEEDSDVKNAIFKRVKALITSSKPTADNPADAVPPGELKPAIAIAETIAPALVEHPGLTLDKSTDLSSSTPQHNLIDPKPVKSSLVEHSPRQSKAVEKLAYTVQLGAFSTAENAATFRSFWQRREYDVFISEIQDAEGEIRYAVRSGLFHNLPDAKAFAVHIRHKESVSALVLQTRMNQATEVVNSVIGTNSQNTPQEIATPEIATPAIGAPIEQQSVINEHLIKSAAFQKNGKAEFTYTVQLGAFSTPENAAKAESHWKAKGYDVYVSEIKDAAQRTRFAVRTGIFSQRREAALVLRTLKRKDGFRALLVIAQLKKENQPAKENSLHLSGLNAHVALLRYA